MDIEIKRLGHRGDGITETGIFAPLTLPGEIVQGRVEGDRLHDVRIVTPSDHRVRPICRHFKSCGGCQIMHASEGFVAGWKQEIVVRALQAQGLETDFRPLVTSPAQSRRRATFAVRRIKSGHLAGFYGRASATIVDVPNCQLITAALQHGRMLAGEIAQIGASRKATLDVQVTESLSGLDVAVSGGKDLDPAAISELSALCARYNVARLSWDGEVLLLHAPPEIALGPARVVPPPGAFLQATKHGQEALTQAVCDAVGPAPARIVDLFAGCGTFSLPLAERAPVHAIEGAPDMLAALAQGWRHAVGLKSVTTEPRDLFRNPLLPEELKPYDTVVIDPPRAGGEAQTHQVAQAKTPVIAFVSCNPVTFARDAKILTNAGYALEWVQVVDQFRWSTHVELAARFALAHM